ncbi:MAG TPA: YdcF family protein [Bryobacteraceae bacterium]|nr:YdcF family protein [Bryobacteraceae bacterium]
MRFGLRKILGVFRALCVAVVILLLVITFTPLDQAVAGKLATDWYDGGGDVLVVLGGSMLVPGTGAQTALGYDSYLRTTYAAWVLHSRRFSWVVVSGGGGLAQAMDKLLTQSGVQPGCILQETQSTSTFENAIYVQDLLERRRLLKPQTRIVILTSDYHSWRAYRVFEKQGMYVRVIPAPDVLKQASSRIYRWQGFFTLLNEFGKDIAYAAMGRL